MLPVEQLQPLGDRAVQVSCVNEGAALSWAAVVRRLAPPWLVEVVQAYTTVAVYFDLDRINYRAASDWLRAEIRRTPSSDVTDSRLHHIPCCYERQLDLERVARQTKLAAAVVIRLHTATEYTVYAIGFCPGFPYLGYLPEALCGVPRLESPRLRVEPGSVGVTGRQTGIYTEARPGGWNLIGRTPLCLVDVADGYFPLRTGDRVRFVAIDEATFRELEGRRLA
jgi:inhibitor of KinA